MGENNYTLMSFVTEKSRYPPPPPFLNTNTTVHLDKWLDKKNVHLSLGLPYYIVYSKTPVKLLVEAKPLNFKVILLAIL